MLVHQEAGMKANHLTVRLTRIITALLLLSNIFFEFGSGESSIVQAQAPGDRISAIGALTTPPITHSVQFYRASQYGQGTCYGDNAGNYMNLDACPGFDENISSVLINSGWSVRVYKDRNLEGTSKCFMSSDDDLANDTFEDGSALNNQVSSFVLYAQSSCPPLILPPVAPSLFNPGNGSAHPHNYDLTFQWLFSSGADEYLLEWWGGPYGTAQPCGWNSSVSCHIGTVAPGNTYYWHVKARSSGGESGWSSTWSVTIRPVPPAAFNKISPADGAANQSTSPTLSWGTSSGATSYDYCYVTAGQGACSNWTSNGISTSKVIAGLDPFTTYYWHVRAVNGGGNTYSDNSPVAWSFTTGSGVDVYEPDNSSAQARTINPGMAQTHSIIPASDVDWVVFTLNTTSAVTLENTGMTSSDTEMWLYNSSLTQLRYSNDEGTGAYSLITLNCGVDALPAGTYYVKISEFGSNAEIANYQLSLNSSGCPSAAIFTDVPLTYWANSFIERLYNAGITGGCATNPLQYCPEASVTRAQMAVFLLRGIHTSSYTPPGIGPGTGFGDVPPTYWSAAWIKQLATEGITTGCGNGNYCPEHPVTRSQMAVFLLRSKHGASYTPPGVGAGTGFGDVLPDYWAAAWIKQLVTEGITSGCGNGNYCPENPVTRAQMAVFLVRTFGLP
jgi:hypothetical protein